MSDDKFLYELREEMPQEFGKKLYQKLQRQEQPQRHMATLAAALIVAILGMSLLFARASNSILPTAQSSLPDLQPISGENIAQAEVLRTLGNGTAEGVAWSPDGTTIAIAGSQGLFLHNADDLSDEPRQILMSATQHPAYSPNGSVLSVINEDAIVQLNPTTGEVLNRIEVGDVQYFDLLYNTDGTKLATMSCYDDEAWVIELVYPCMQNTVRTWDAFTGEELSSLDIGSSYNISLNDDFNLLAWTDSRTRIYVRDLTTDIERVLVNGPLSSGTIAVAFNGDQLYVLTPYDAHFRVWDTATLFDDNEVLQINYRNIPDYTGASQLLFLPDDNIVTVVANIGLSRIDVRDIEGNMLRTMSYSAFAITDIVLNPDKTRLVMIASDGTLVEWDITSGEKLSEFKHYTNYLSAMAFSNDHSTLAAVSGDKNIYVWNLDTNREQLIEIDASSEENIISMALSPDGNQVAYTLRPSFRDIEAGEEIFYNVWVYELATGESQKVMETPHTRLNSSQLTFIPDGSLIAVINESVTHLNADGTTTTVTINDDMLISSGGYYTPYLSPDGTKLAIIICRQPNSQGNCSIQVVRVWDTRTGELISELPDDEDAFTLSVAFSADSTILVEHTCNIGSRTNGASLYFTCNTATINLWDLSEDTQSEPLSVIYDDSESLLFFNVAIVGEDEPDSLEIVRWDSPNQVRAWRINRSTGDLTLLGTTSFTNMRWRVNPLFSPDNQLLAVSHEGIIQLLGIPAE